MTDKIPPTRDELISICERAIVPQDKWTDRDSESAQHGIGRVWQLLKCGCVFEITDASDQDIWIIRFWVHSFSWFEDLTGDDEYDNKDGYNHDSRGELLSFYIPTELTLKKANGLDWYK